MDRKAPPRWVPTEIVKTAQRYCRRKEVGNDWGIALIDVGSARRRDYVCCYTYEGVHYTDMWLGKKKNKEDDDMNDNTVCVVAPVYLNTQCTWMEVRVPKRNVFPAVKPSLSALVRMEGVQMYHDKHQYSVQVPFMDATGARGMLFYDHKEEIPSMRWKYASDANPKEHHAVPEGQEQSPASWVDDVLSFTPEPRGWLTNDRSRTYALSVVHGPSHGAPCYAYNEDGTWTATPEWPVEGLRPKFASSSKVLQHEVNPATWMADDKSLVCYNNLQVVPLIYPKSWVLGYPLVRKTKSEKCIKTSICVLERNLTKEEINGVVSLVEAGHVSEWYLVRNRNTSREGWVEAKRYLSAVQDVQHLANKRIMSLGFSRTKITARNKHCKCVLRMDKSNLLWDESTESYVDMTPDDMTAFMDRRVQPAVWRSMVKQSSLKAFNEALRRVLVNGAHAAEGDIWRADESSGSYFHHACREALMTNKRADVPCSICDVSGGVLSCGIGGDKCGKAAHLFCAMLSAELSNDWRVMSTGKTPVVLPFCSQHSSAPLAAAAKLRSALRSRLFITHDGETEISPPQKANLRLTEDQFNSFTFMIYVSFDLRFKNLSCLEHLTLTAYYEKWNGPEGDYNGTVTKPQALDGESHLFTEELNDASFPMTLASCDSDIVAAHFEGRFSFFEPIPALTRMIQLQVSLAGFPPTVVEIAVVKSFRPQAPPLHLLQKSFLAAAHVVKLCDLGKGNETIRQADTLADMMEGPLLLRQLSPAERAVVLSYRYMYRKVAAKLQRAALFIEGLGSKRSVLYEISALREFQHDYVFMVEGTLLPDLAGLWGRVLTAMFGETHKVSPLKALKAKLRSMRIEHSPAALDRVARASECVFTEMEVPRRPVQTAAKAARKQRIWQSVGIPNPPRHNIPPTEEEVVVKKLSPAKERCTHEAKSNANRRKKEILGALNQNIEGLPKENLEKIETLQKKPLFLSMQEFANYWEWEQSEKGTMPPETDQVPPASMPVTEVTRLESCLNYFQMERENNKILNPIMQHWAAPHPPPGGNGRIVLFIHDMECVTRGFLQSLEELCSEFHGLVKVCCTTDAPSDLHTLLSSMVPSLVFEGISMPTYMMDTVVRNNKTKKGGEARPAKQTDLLNLQSFEKIIPSAPKKQQVALWVLAVLQRKIQGEVTPAVLRTNLKKMNCGVDYEKELITFGDHGLVSRSHTSVSIPLTSTDSLVTLQGMLQEKIGRWFHWNVLTPEALG